MYVLTAESFIVFVASIGAVDIAVAHPQLGDTLAVTAGESFAVILKQMKISK